jgi:peptidoglycan/xylan/chitin deacetylase (PgdA/CDA1 family)
MDKPALVSLTFDDGLRCQFERAVPILNQLGLPATFFLCANTAPIHVDWCANVNLPQGPDLPVCYHPEWRKMSWCENDISFLRKMRERGHKIGSHSVWHLKADSPNLDPQFEAAESKQLIESWIEEKISSFCYPFGEVSAPLKKAVIDAGYAHARSAAKDTLAKNPVIYPNSMDLFDLGCHGVGTNEVVNSWVYPGGWYVLMYHGIGTDQDGSAYITVDEFARQMGELAKLRDSGSAEVLTFEAGADRLRQSSLEVAAP